MNGKCTAPEGCAPVRTAPSNLWRLVPKSCLATPFSTQPGGICDETVYPPDPSWSATFESLRARGDLGAVAPTTATAAPPTVTVGATPVPSISTLPTNLPTLQYGFGPTGGGGGVSFPPISLPGGIEVTIPTIPWPGQSGYPPSPTPTPVPKPAPAPWTCPPGYAPFMSTCIPTAGLPLQQTGQQPIPPGGQQTTTTVGGGKIYSQTTTTAPPAPTQTGAGIGCPVGYHPNKSAYWTNAGYVAKGSKCVRNRRRNPLNPRALDRALGRITSAKRAARKLGRVTVRKTCPSRR